MENEEEKINCIKSNGCAFFLSKLFRSLFAEWSVNPIFHVLDRKF